MNTSGSTAPNSARVVPSPEASCWRAVSVPFGSSRRYQTVPSMP
jgi:hypothetical protein